MLLNSLRYAYGHIRYIVRTSANERPVSAVIYLIRETINLIFGMFAATAAGWTESILGPGHKVRGSKGITMGKNASIKRQAWIEAVFSYNAQTFSPTISVGQGFVAADRLHISAINRIEIGDNCLFGSGVYISDHNHGVYKGSDQSSPQEPPIERKLVSFGPVVIGDNVWIGDHVVIIGPVTIGKGVVVGANSVVTRDIPDNTIAAGSPARILKKFNLALGQWEQS